MFRKRAVPVTLSAMLPEPGSAMAHDGYGAPLLVTRDRNGEAHAFFNVCQHKGSKLLKDGELVKDTRLVCPYHAWTFGLDGKLIGVPRQEAFVNLDKASRNLKALPTREWGGFIWVMLDAKAEPDFSSLVPELAEDMVAFDLPTAHVYGRKTFHLKANWKLVQEPFLEGYHVTRLHAQSIGALYADVPNVVDHLGSHIRQISGKANFTPADLDLPDENVHKIVTHAYLIFPNTVVVTSPYYLSVMFIMPNAVNKTTVDYFMLPRAPADNPKAEALYARSPVVIISTSGSTAKPKGVVFTHRTMSSYVSGFA